MTDNEKKMLMAEIVERMIKIYPEPVCSLRYCGDPWRLLIMARLSAQCTDERVNTVSGPLFEKYPDASAMADANINELEELVRPCGLYRTKAANIKEASAIIRDRFGGALPDNIEDMLTLPGVGRKIANLLLGDIYGVPGIVADTHLIRICGRLGMYPEEVSDPLKVEKILSTLVEPEKQSDFCHRMVMFGREYCPARAPKCLECPLADLCRHRSARL
jgi:endonuclease-3